MKKTVGVSVIQDKMYQEVLRFFLVRYRVPTAFRRADLDTFDCFRGERVEQRFCRAGKQAVSH